MKKYSCRIFFTAIVAAFMSFALIACGDDSTSASNDDTPVSSSEENETPSSSSEENLNEINFCNEQNQNPKIGDVCSYQKLVGSGRWQYYETKCYRYKDEDWTYIGRPEDVRLFYMYAISCEDLVTVLDMAPDEECSLEKEGNTDSLLLNAATPLYYKCTEGKWTLTDAVDYYCIKEKAIDGDKCLLVRDGENRYYRKINNRWAEVDTLSYVCSDAIGDTCSLEKDGATEYYCYEQAGWSLCGSFKKGLGLCSIETDPSAIELDGKYYYCDLDRWYSTALVPHQDTDPRKEGLTDEEFDVLDLPKEASVGDRMGGLLERCEYNKKFTVFKPGETNEYIKEMYNHCEPVNYYRYRKDGSWTLETEEEYLSAEDALFEVPCTEKTVGTKSVELSHGGSPERIWQCVCNSVGCAYYGVEYNFSRFEKK